MNFYKDLFGKPYAFRKYDQVFVPEFNEGGMENVGCVTYTEKLLYKDEAITLGKRLSKWLLFCTSWPICGSETW